MRPGWNLIWLALVVVVAPLSGQRGRGQVEEGNRLYADKRYDDARAAYLEALKRDPNSPLIRFNEGNALYQSTDFQQAAEAYQRALESGDPALQGKAWYNLGNALYRQQQLQESIEAYKQALRVNPNDTDAKHNLEFVTRQLQRQPQNQDHNQDQNQQQPDSSSQNQQQQQGNQNNDQNQNQGKQQQQQEQGDDRQQQSGQEQQPNSGQGERNESSGARPTEMSREDAERLLDAIKEDPGDIQRKLRSQSPRRRVRKPW